MKVKREDMLDVAAATAKGAISSIPIAGGLISEYIGLAQEKVRDKRLNEWINMVNEKMLKLEISIEELSSNEFFYTCFQTAFFNVSKTHELEKREYFANALMNSIQMDISSDKKIIFLNLLDRYTLSHLVILKYFSQNNYHEEDFIIKSGSTTTTIHPGTEFPIQYLIEKIPSFSKEKEYVKLLADEMHLNGIIENIDWSMPVYPKEARKKRITNLGEEFLKFISSGN